MPVVTITVNQWRIKSNAETGTNEPVVCVNYYEWVKTGFNRKTGKVWRIWGPKIWETAHCHAFVLPADARNVQTIYDPVNKTPCGASYWVEYKE